MSLNTKISKGYQTVVPSEIRKKFDLKPEDIVKWKVTEKGAEVIFKKKISIYDVAGIVKGDPKNPTNAVELKKKAQTGDDKI